MPKKPKMYKLCDDIYVANINLEDVEVSADQGARSIDIVFDNCDDQYVVGSFTIEQATNLMAAIRHCMKQLGVQTL